MDDSKKAPESILRDVFESERHQDPEILIQELGRDLVNRLFMLYRTGRVHDLGNDAVANALRALLKVIDEVSVHMKEIHLLSIGDAFYLNKILLKVDFSTFENFRHLSETMKTLHISGFQFVRSEESDLRALLVAWKNSSEDPSQIDWIGHFDNPRVSVTPAGDLEESEKRMISPETLSDPTYLLRLYMKSLFGVRFFMSSLQSGEFISLSGLQRSIHEFIDAMGNETRNILALSSIRIHEDRFSSNAINVTLLSLLMGRDIGLDRNKLSDLGMAAFLHDVGRVEISEDILNKAGSLTEEEKKTISQSNRLSLMQLVKLRGFNESALRRMLVAFEHTLDASKDQGFKKPTVLARIVAITHCFVAMTTPQPYRDAMLPSEALKIMTSEGETKFDPALLKVFLRLVTSYPPGSLVLLQSGEIALVADAVTSRVKALEPKIRILYDKEGKKTPPFERQLHSEEEPERIKKGLDPSKLGINPLRDLFPIIAKEVDSQESTGGNA